MKQIRFLIISLGILLISHQKTNAQAMPWHLHSDSTNIKTYYQIQNCNGQEFLLLKFIYNDVSSRTIHYTAYGMLPLNTIVLAASEEMEGSCSRPDHLRLLLPAGTSPASLPGALKITY